MKQIVILLLLCVYVGGSPDWGYYKGSPERTGSTDAPAPDTAYLLWKVDTGPELYSSPVIWGEKVFQVAFERILSINCDTGEILWTSSVPAYHSTPALSDGKVIVATNRGVSTLSMGDGDIIWEYNVSGRFSKRFSLSDYIISSPVVSDGKVIVGTRAYQFLAASGSWLYQRDDLNVICLDEDTGREKWYIKTFLGVRSSPCAANGKVFAASREMLCVDLETGRIVWNSEDNYPYDFDRPKEERYAFDYSTPALYHGILVGGSCDLEWDTQEQRYLGWQKIVAMDQYTGDIFWEWGKEGALASSPIIHEGKIYFYSYDGMVKCLSLLSGEELWTTSISEPREYESKGFRLWPSPAAADGKVYIGSIEGVFYCLDGCTGDVLWKYEMGGSFHSAPAIVPGKVLVSSGDGSLYCFGIDPRTYKLKAEKYFEEKAYEKAEEYLLKSIEYAGASAEIDEIENLLVLTQAEMTEYGTSLDKLSAAESLLDEADEILWDKEFLEALDLYTKAMRIYEELGNKFGVLFCKSRIDYIQLRIQLEGQQRNYWWLFIILACLGVSFCVLRKNRKSRACNK